MPHGLEVPQYTMMLSARSILLPAQIKIQYGRQLFSKRCLERRQGTERETSSLCEPRYSAVRDPRFYEARL